MGIRNLLFPAFEKFFSFADMSRAKQNHQKANLPMNTADRRMTKCHNPVNKCNYTGYQCCQRHPPKNTGKLAFKFMKSTEPVIIPEMQEYMVGNESEEGYSYGNMNPDRRLSTTIGSLKINT